MHFSRIALKDGASHTSDFWRAFRDPYMLHQSIWKLFADHTDRRRDFLYRLDEENARFRIYAVSVRAPKIENDLWSIESKPYEPKIQGGTRLAFTLRANPVRKKSGKRHDVVMESKRRLRSSGDPREDWPLRPEIVQHEGAIWLEARAGNGGFNIESSRVDGYRRWRFIKRGAVVQISTMEFTGVLTVLDPERFLQVLWTGIGPAKSFGCGLLLVRRI